jgi:DNA polymerase-3 subunit gamma/tau
VKGSDVFLKELSLITPDKNHSYLFKGPSGSGKTSVARILAEQFCAFDADIIEMNSSDYNGVDDIRNLISDMDFCPLGKAKVYILDECHKLSSNAQQALLKPLEEYPPFVYFFLLTTEPTSIIATIKSRCTSIIFQGLTDESLYSILRDVKKAEDFELTRDELESIVGAADGNARKALVLLETIAGLPAGDRSMYIQENGLTENKYIIDLCRALFSDGLVWGDVLPILNSMKEQKEDPEKIRRAVLGYGQAIMLKHYDEKVYRIMKDFQQSTYDCGFPGVILACANIFNRAEIRRF